MLGGGAFAEALAATKPPLGSSQVFRVRKKVSQEQVAIKASQLLELDLPRKVPAT